jgi:uncharacterized membrane protein YkvA (DUF1232 family)
MSDNNISKPENTHSFENISQEQVEQELPDWYDLWRSRIQTWVKEHTDEQFAKVVLLLPDLLALIVRLAQDRRVPFLLKGQLLLAAAYVISPLDLVPEAALGVIGLTEDAGVMALILYSLQNLGKIDIAVLKDNWSGDDNPSEVIDQIHTTIIANKDHFFDSSVWQKIQKRFGAASTTSNDEQSQAAS